jgi:hypothetical protein
MARKLQKAGFATVSQFARKLGVSQSAVSQAVKNGRLVAYDGRGERVSPGYAGRKWLNPASAVEDWHTRRQRYDDSAASDDLLAAKTKTANLQSELLQLRLGRESGELIPRDEALAAAEDLARGVRQALKGIAGWELGGLEAVSARLQALSAEIGDAIGNLTAAAAEDCAESPPDRDDAC